MKIEENISLKAFNTFGIDVKTRYFGRFSSLNELAEAFQFIKEKNMDFLILGGGSNILFTKDFDGIVLKNELKGINAIKEDNNHVYVEAYAGEVWHNLVMYCVNNNYQGIENLSLIPGCIGAAPMQNIGAYGVELKDVFYSLQAFNIESSKVVEFDLLKCEFSYRESYFKHSGKNKFVIVSVTIRLNKIPQYNTSYGNLKEYLLNENNNELTTSAISNAVIAIRRSKLPDPREIGNAGSFFKNPQVSAFELKNLLKKFPDLVFYKIDENNFKLAAGWLIEKAGYKGKRINNYGVHKNQALVLVNYGNAKGIDVYNLSEEIIKNVFLLFGVKLEREVNIY